MLVYDEKVLRRFWRIAIPSRDSEISGVIMRIVKTNTSPKRPVKKLFSMKNTQQGTNQTDTAREQRLRREAAVIVELKRQYEC